MFGTGAQIRRVAVVGSPNTAGASDTKTEQIRQRKKLAYCCGMPKLAWHNPSSVHRNVGFLPHKAPGVRATWYYCLKVLGGRQHLKLLPVREQHLLHPKQHLTLFQYATKYLGNAKGHIGTSYNSRNDLNKPPRGRQEIRPLTLSHQV